MPDEPLLKNLASNVPLTRLRAMERLGRLLREWLDQWLYEAELEQVRTARAAGATWRDIGDALDLSHTQAQRHFKDRL